MVYALTYRRPPYVDSARASMIGDEKTKSIGESSFDSGSTGVTSGIPEALSFNRIISGGTCPVSNLPSLLSYASEASIKALLSLGFLSSPLLPLYQQFAWH